MSKPSDNAMHPGLANRSEDELDWLAFCFVSGEMSGDEQAAFEDRLVDDQPAREAVARAVELCQAAAIAFSREAERPQPARIAARSRSWPRSLAWMSIGISAALALAMAWIQFGGIEAWFNSPSPSPPDLAEVWSQTRESVREIVQAEPLDAQPLPEMEPTGDLSLPSWITAAVFNQPAGDDPDADGSATHDET